MAKDIYLQMLHEEDLSTLVAASFGQAPLVYLEAVDGKDMIQKITKTDAAFGNVTFEPLTDQLINYAHPIDFDNVRHEQSLYSILLTAGSRFGH